MVGADGKKIFVLRGLDWLKRGRNIDYFEKRVSNIFEIFQSKYTFVDHFVSIDGRIKLTMILVMILVSKRGKNETNVSFKPYKKL